MKKKKKKKMKEESMLYVVVSRLQKIKSEVEYTFTDYGDQVLALRRVAGVKLLIRQLLC